MTICEYKFSKAEAVQYVDNVKKLEDRFSEYPDWLKLYIHDNMIKLHEGNDVIVVCVSYKDSIYRYGNNQHILKLGDWVVCSDDRLFCYNNDEFDYLYLKN